MGRSLSLLFNLSSVILILLLILSPWLFYPFVIYWGKTNFDILLDDLSIGLLLPLVFISHPYRYILIYHILNT